MSAIDELHKARANDYGDNPGSQDKDPDEPNDTSRIIKLSDDEQKSFEGSKPGEELECLVRGNLEEDGHFHVMSVSPPQGGSYKESGQGEPAMAQQVAQMVRPQLQVSPS